ncbi:MAG: tetratricopeptide repeat protein [bacterium]|nr:tetratricopeptide repeat protein [bacterium]
MRVLILMLLLTVTACSLRFPTVAEEQKLVSDGAFPGGVPGWIPKTVGIATAADVAYESGAIPTSFARQESSMGMPTAVNYRAAVQKSRSAVQDESEEKVDDKDLIGKVLVDCPNIERQLTLALTEIDAPRRVGMFERLTAICPRRAELWLWLGDAYQKDGKFVAARGAFERALMVSPDNAQASASLQNLKGQNNR